MSTWTPVQPSASVVQQHFVNARVGEINRQFGDRYKTDTIQQFRTDPTLALRLKGYSSSKKLAFCEDAYRRITKDLQSKDLTINLKAASWFTNENPYESYAQMYEKAVKGGRMILDDSDPNNPAEIRSATDDRVTFPTQWAGAQAPAQRGLRPGVQSPQKIMGRMMVGKTLVPLGGNTAGYLNPVPNSGEFRGYEPPNIRFDPKSKQVFAALNYGQRPHGSSTFYGKSYLVLKNHLKVDSVYFPEDTFYLSGADIQVSYQTLGAIFLKAKATMRAAIVQSCFDGIRLPDTSDGAYLMEAHVFQPVKFATDVAELRLEPSAPGIMNNAKKFCNKWGIKLAINLL
ncbi:MAG: hypothetical protein WBD10_08080 [Acidobacteriaceae bacterium]